MATYYVRPDGNDSNTGLGSTAILAWRTIQKALGSTGIGSGDTVYIAPGLYGEQVTIGGTYSAATYITGDPTAAQFSGVTAGRVQIGAFSAASSAALYQGQTISGTGKSYLNFSSIEFLLNCTTGNPGINLLTGRYNAFDKCIFQLTVSATAWFMSLSPPTSTALDCTIKNCIFIGTTSSGSQCVVTGQSVVSDTSSISNCLFIGQSVGVLPTNITVSVTNCEFVNQSLAGILQSGTLQLTSKNNLFFGCATGASFTNSSSGTQTNCRYIACGATFTNVPSSASSSVIGVPGFETGYTLLTGQNPVQFFGSYNGSPNTSFGNATGAPVTDLYGIAWSGVSPDAGSATFRNIGGIGYYVPTERNASTITIAPGSTSQSIELYLGATGLTASTSGLSARYNRTRTASVSIPLVARTIAQAWTSGGFAEVDATNMPGVYRLDIPDAALAAGADDVTIVVRGASGTNGAVMTVKLSSGGLTEAQTASAVWDAARASYVTAGTFGEYVNAELVTPVTSAALVRMGPYEVKADGLGASDPLDIQKGAQHGVDIQCVDAFGSGIDITSATVTAKVYNSGATLVDTYACTATYAADGRATFTIDTTVTNSPGTYTATITRTTGASDTQVFGPLRVYVRDI